MIIERINEIVEIAEKAGEIILSYYQEGAAITQKVDDTPVTEADFAASEFIVKELNNSFPDIPCLSEESPEEVFKERLKWSEYFLIDPLDGTKEFINRNGEFTVNIAYIQSGVSMAGVIHVPVYKTSYWGYSFPNNKESFLKEKSQIYSLPRKEFVAGFCRVVSSKSHKNERTENYLKNLKSKFERVEAKTFGSSLKICKVAEGIVDLNPRLGRGTKEWDIAAAHAILKGAGGNIYVLGTMDEVSYTKDELFNPEYEAKRKELLKLNLV